MVKRRTEGTSFFQVRFSLKIPCFPLGFGLTFGDNNWPSEAPSGLSEVRAPELHLPVYPRFAAAVNGCDALRLSVRTAPNVSLRSIKLASPQYTSIHPFACDFQTFL